MGTPSRAQSPGGGQTQAAPSLPSGLPSQLPTAVALTLRGHQPPILLHRSRGECSATGKCTHMQSSRFPESQMPLHVSGSHTSLKVPFHSSPAALPSPPMHQNDMVAGWRPLAQFLRPAWTLTLTAASPEPPSSSDAVFRFSSPLATPPAIVGPGLEMPISWGQRECRLEKSLAP